MANHPLSEELSDWEQIQASSVDSEVSVFPPRSHENLHTTTNSQDIDRHLQEQESTNPMLPLTNGDNGPGRWRRPLLDLLRNAIFRVSEKVGKYFANNGVGFQSFAWRASGVVACLAMALYLLHRRVLAWCQRRMRLDRHKERLAEVIRQKDEKINQLLLQIAKMNEILLARRRVPVVRVK